ncbi:MAG: multidrug efflux pump subunit AcrB [Planctomycetota bacterium]|jgi:multidrug efflux pump subunit AcrB
MLRWIARLAVDNSVAVNLAALTLCLAGFVTYFGMPREVFPVFSQQSVEVQSFYAGSSPEDVERLITLPLEDELFAIDGLDSMTSTSQEGTCTIVLETSRSTDISDFLDEVRAAVQRAKVELPSDVEEPRVRELKAAFPVIAVYVYGWGELDEMRLIAEDHRRGIEDIRGVSNVRITGIREPRIWIEVDPLALERFSLTLEQVGSAVEARATDLPLGSLAGSATNTLLRIESGVEYAADLLELPLVTTADGGRVLLRDVAHVSDARERDITRSRFNGQPAIHLQVNKEADGDTISISQEVHEYVAEVAQSLPEGVALGLNTDLSIYVSNRLEVMRNSALIGGLLVLISLVIFLNLRVALVTALGIPVSFLGGLLLAGMFGVTMNMMTMFAFIVVLGMVVDDAIVVGENCFRLLEEGRSPREAAIEGVVQVGRPVFATILTSIAAFLPILMMSGLTGEFLRPLPLIVSFCLVVSLLEALIVLPAHMAHWGAGRTKNSDSVSVVATSGGKAHWYWFLRDAYLACLRAVLRWRWIALTTAITGALLLGTYARYWVPFNLFDEFESKIVYANLRLAAGCSLEESERAAIELERRILESLPATEVESVNVLIGISASDSNNYALGKNLAQLWIELAEGPERTLSTQEFSAELRKLLVDVSPQVVSTEVAQPQSGPTGKAIDIWVRGPELEVLAEISDLVQRELESYVGVYDVHDNLDLGGPQITLRIKDTARLQGVTEHGLGMQLRSAFEGLAYGNVRRGRDDIELIVKFPETARFDPRGLAKVRISLPSGERVPLESVAEFLPHVGPSRITRDDRERAANIVADIDKSQNSAENVTSEVGLAFANLADNYPGYTLDYKGDQEDISESMADLGLASFLSLAVIFLILATLFRSASQPFVIMFIIPFGMVGMVFGHLIMDRSISLMSLIGLLALTGVVVNDSLILIEFVNGLRREGLSLMDSLVKGCSLRFRPILLTTITTMLGLSPLTFFVTGQARFLQPMAISLFFGLFLATFLVVFLVPCAYAALEDVLHWFRRPLRTTRQLLRGETIHF